jgi:SPX domain protein involved in polyphosphate accumulation
MMATWWLAIFKPKCLQKKYQKNQITIKRMSRDESKTGDEKEDEKFLRLDLRDFLMNDSVFKSVIDFKCERSNKKKEREFTACEEQTREMRAGWWR